MRLDLWKDYINNSSFSVESECKIQIGKINAIKNKVPDEYVLVDEVISSESLNKVYELCKSSLEEYNLDLFPVLSLLGGHLICAKSIENNFHFYYVDFDFGCFKLAESVGEFLELVEC